MFTPLSGCELRFWPSAALEQDSWASEVATQGLRVHGLGRNKI